METIRELLSGDHRRCDDFFANAERAVDSGDWTRVAAAFSRFAEAMAGHFRAEEEELFPAFEERTGMRSGPTQVMRMEHAQMRELIEAMRQAIESRDAGDYSGYAETLLIMMQQHNMKEENVLYPMCDQHLSDRLGALRPSLAALLPD